MYERVGGCCFCRSVDLSIRPIADLDQTSKWMSESFDFNTVFFYCLFCISIKRHDSWDDNCVLNKKNVNKHLNEN